jgi:hypothetical protein
MLAMSYQSGSSVTALVIMTGLQVNQSEMERRNNLNISEFKTMLTLYTPVSILEEEIDKRRGKRSKRDLSSRTLEAGLLLSDQEKIIVMTSVVPSGKQVSSQPRTTAVEEAAVLDATTTTATTTANSQEETQEVGV